MDTLKARTIEEDHNLFLRLKQNPQVIGEVYDMYADQLYGFVMKRCAHRETAEDVVSKTFVKLLEARTKLEWQGFSLGAWLFRVASNALIDYWRTAAVRLDEELESDVWTPPADDDPSWNAEVAFESTRIQATMKTLSSRDQEVLTLRFFGGYETAEIAATLGIDANHAAVLLYRAVGRLRQKYMASIAT